MSPKISKQPKLVTLFTNQFTLHVPKIGKWSLGQVCTIHLYTVNFILGRHQFGSLLTFQVKVVVGLLAEQVTETLVLICVGIVIFIPIAVTLTLTLKVNEQVKTSL